VNRRAAAAVVAGTLTVGTAFAGHAFDSEPAKCVTVPVCANSSLPAPWWERWLPV